MHNPDSSSKNGFPAGLSISDYDYDLPDQKIARYPLEQREKSRLLVWTPEKTELSTYEKLADFLPAPAVLVLNNSRVVEARILFKKPSGGQIEIFCLEPDISIQPVPSAMLQTGKVLWTCLIGGASKWKRGQVLQKKIGDILLEARFVEKKQDDFSVEFSWTPEQLSFAELLHSVGSIPLPPYLKRVAEATDEERYQTIYAREPGSVAAPTAGLHFTEQLLKKLSDHKIRPLYLTLHVGAGTFMPVKTENLSEHNMHEEFIEVSAVMLEELINRLDEPVIAVGTTSLRTLETLYWLGLAAHEQPYSSDGELTLSQWTPYQKKTSLSAKDSLIHLLNWVRQRPDKKLMARTRLFIVPGYSFKIVNGLITNFHQPRSTLLLLVAALIGPSWKNVYAFALENEFRFLSYGDGCLFLPQA